MMKFVGRRPAAVLAFFALAALAANAQERKADAKEPNTRSLKLKLSYTGAGSVDDKHKMFVFLFDSPDFIQGQGVPFASKSVANKAQTVLLEGLTVSSVYVVVAYDPTGEYDGESGPPPQGSSLGMHADSSGAPEPIKIQPGATAEVALTFDDTIKM